MPINKPTIAHQLKTVNITKQKFGSVIHTTPNIGVTGSHKRSHLRGGSTTQWRKSSYDKSEDVVVAGDLSQSDLQQCTRILRNVLANEALNKTMIREQKNKSTSTDDCPSEERILNKRFVDFKSPDFSVNTERGSDSEKLCGAGDIVEEVTEAESLTSVAEQKTITENPKISRLQPIVQQKLCTCPSDIRNKSQIIESKEATGSRDCTRMTNDKVSVCVRCHNIIPQINHLDKNSDLASCYDRFSENHNSKHYSPNNIGEYKTPVHFDNIGDEKIDNLIGLLQVKLNEISLIARTTRDADLDRLVSEIDRAFQQIIRENSLVFGHLKTIAKTLKWDNSGLKQKVKSQSETNRDLKSEIKLLRQENKQKIEELKLEMQLKEEEVHQLTEKDKNSMTHWREKYHSLEKEHEKMRSEYQGQVLQACQKDTEMIQLKHLYSQSESKLKEQIHASILLNQNLQMELSKAQDANKMYEQECQHNQSIIKSARDHVINLLDRHRHSREGSSSVSYKFDPLCDTPVNGSGDWINQATSLQQVLSMVSDTKDGHNLTSSSNYCPKYSKQCDISRSMTISPINYATSNYNNNYVSSSSCNPNKSELSKTLIDDSVDQLKYMNAYHDVRPCSRSPSDISSTVSPDSFDFSQKNTKDNILTDLEDRSHRHGTRLGPSDDDCVATNVDSWNLDMPKAKMSSASSIMSTVSSLRSTDDRQFRSGLQRLDSQICRLQTTLQQKLLCKS